ncbi:MAG TPA: outer membrane beta-barrel protein [Steroidobacteraceae bacterium]|nr:outer membrane beta-barrel protein [Steroidobacteraceae bacterium]
MKLGKVVLGSLMLASAPLAAMADDMSYSYVDAAYVETDIDGAPSADGFGLRGSVGFAENWFVFANYSSQSVQGIDLDAYSVGVGGHYSMMPQLDLVGRVGYTKLEVDAGGGFSADDDGYLLDLGLRGLVTEGVELEGGLHYTDFDEGGDDTGFYFGGRFHFNETWALGAEYQSSDDADTILAYVRASF